jgi:GTPase SAR1 family protein
LAPSDETRKIKICLVGDVGVGKTSLIRRYVLDVFDDKYIATIGTKVTKKEIEIKDPKTVHLRRSARVGYTGQSSFREVLLSILLRSRGFPRYVT